MLQVPTYILFVCKRLTLVCTYGPIGESVLSTDTNQPTEKIKFKIGTLTLSLHQLWLYYCSEPFCHVCCYRLSICNLANFTACSSFKNQFNDRPSHKCVCATCFSIFLRKFGTDYENQTSETTLYSAGEQPQPINQ